MDYPQAVGYLNSFINYEQIPAYPYKESIKLERLEAFLERLGRPQDHLRCLHVAGSKGKGSTCAFAAYILRQAGYRTGLYTSPHLSDFRERIRILGRRKQGEFEGMITKKKLAALITRLKPQMGKYNKASRYGPLTFFEACTAAALVYFKEKKVDFAVLETGLGGRLDATNLVNPLACAITPISYEHTQKLGNTLRQIAAEKAGIIKEHQAVVISAPQKKEALGMIRKRCREANVELRVLGKEIKYKRNKTGFDIYTPGREYKNLKIGLIGEHQLDNAATAVGMIESLRGYGINISAKSIREGLKYTVWPGRCEVLSRRPLVVLDGAQNEASAKALTIAVKENFRYDKLILVLGISEDKDIPGVCRQLNKIADIVILTRSRNPRASTPEKLRKFFPRRHVYISNSVKQARDAALKIAKKRDLVLATGSLFVVGEFKR